MLFLISAIWAFFHVFPLSGMCFSPNPPPVSPRFSPNNCSSMKSLDLQQHVLGSPIIIKSKALVKPGWCLLFVCISQGPSRVQDTGGLKACYLVDSDAWKSVGRSPQRRETESWFRGKGWGTWGILLGKCTYAFINYVSTWWLLSQK